MLNIYPAISTEGLSFGSCGTSFPEKAFLRSDISQVFETDDILGVPKAIKGFDKSDFCEVISIYQKAGSIKAEHDIWYPLYLFRLKNIGKTKV